jgi:hypothetical protein
VSGFPVSTTRVLCRHGLRSKTFILWMALKHSVQEMTGSQSTHTAILQLTLGDPVGRAHLSGSSPLPSRDLHGTLQASAEAKTLSDYSKNPITGIGTCCAPATSGHAAAAPPSSVMNSRRLTRSPRRRGLAASAGQCDTISWSHVWALPMCALIVPSQCGNLERSTPLRSGRQSGKFK